FPYAGYFSSRKYHGFPSLYVQIRPPSPRADSLIRRNLSSPGIAVGWIWMNSPLAYLAPCWYKILAAEPVLIIELVDLPKIIPGPPVAIIVASAGKALISCVERFWATIPRPTPLSSRIAPINSQFSYLVTR